MASNLINIILCALPESLYFCLFIIVTKKLKTKRILLFTLMFLEYVILMITVPYNTWFHILYTFMTFVILKILYKEKAIITDIFVFGLSSLIMIIVSVVSYMSIMTLFNNYTIAYIIQRILLFVVLFLLRNKLKNADNLTYMLYKYKFKENRTFEEISQLLDIETNRITEKLDKIDFAIRIYCKI